MSKAIRVTIEPSGEGYRYQLFAGKRPLTAFVRVQAGEPGYAACYALDRVLMGHGTEEEERQAIAQLVTLSLQSGSQGEEKASSSHLLRRRQQLRKMGDEEVRSSKRISQSG